MKKLSQIFIVFLAALSLAACVKQEKKKVEITLIHGWGSAEEEHIRVREIYQDFEKGHPNIKLNLSSMTSSEEVVLKVKNMISVGEIPDLIFTGGYGVDSVYEFMVENDKALDLTPYIKADEDFQNNIAPEILYYWKKGGHLYTVSDVLMAGGGYWYNEDIFQSAGISEVPRTWEDFLSACERIKKWSDDTGKNVIPIQITQENSAYLMDALLSDVEMKRNVPWFETLPEGNFQGALEVMKKIYSYDAKSGSQYGYRDAGNLFNSEAAAMYINGVWASKLIDEALNVKYAPFPSKDGGTSACFSASLGYIAGNTKDKEKMDASVEFLKYMVSDEVQTRILQETGQMPSNPKIDLKNYQEKEPRLYQAVSSIRAAKKKMDIPNNVWPSGRLEYFQNHIFRVLKEEMTGEEFFGELLQEVSHKK